MATTQADFQIGILFEDGKTKTYTVPNAGSYSQQQILSNVTALSTAASATVTGGKTSLINTSGANFSSVKSVKKITKTTEDYEIFN